LYKFENFTEKASLNDLKRREQLLLMLIVSYKKLLLSGMILDNATLSDTKSIDIIFPSSCFKFYFAFFDFWYL